MFADSDHSTFEEYNPVQLDQGNHKQIHIICQHNQKTTTQKLDYPKTTPWQEIRYRVPTLHKDMPKKRGKEKSATATQTQKIPKIMKGASDHHITMLQITIMPHKCKRAPTKNFTTEKHRAKLISEEYGIFQCYALQQ